MSKLIYPTGGLYGATNLYASQCSQNLTQGMNNCSFDIPEDFHYANYINGLHGVIHGYVKEINDIKSKIRETDTKLDNLETGLIKGISALPGTLIEERDQLIR